MNVVVLFNQPTLDSAHPEYDSEEWVRTAVEDVCELLAAAGFRVSQLGASSDLRGLAGQLTAARPDVVFNLFEGHADRPATEFAVARLLERLAIPFTGSPSRALRRGLNKHLTKRRLLNAKLPTPWHWVTGGDLPADCEFPWPVILKPARRDASEGIDQSSVVKSRAELDRRLAILLERYGSPVLIEELLPGREFTVALLELPELAAMPITEVQFTLSPAVRWPILSYDAKWHPDSPEYEAMDMLKGVALPGELRASLLALAMSAYRVVGCRDYARIDLRLSQSGEPMILEVNPNPDMCPTACFARTLEVAGIDRQRLMADLVLQAAARGGSVAAPAHLLSEERHA